MTSMYKWQQVKSLKANGVSIKGIVRRLGLSRNTVKKYLRSSSPPSFKVRDYVKMACQFKVEISEMLKKKSGDIRLANKRERKNRGSGI